MKYNIVSILENLFIVVFLGPTLWVIGWALFFFSWRVFQLIFMAMFGYMPHIGMMWLARHVLPL